VSICPSDFTHAYEFAMTAQLTTQPTDDVMTIREMCDTYDVTPRTLRFYEAKELLSPIRSGTKRLFTRRDRARLKLILRGKRFGFSLEDIRQTLDLYDRDGSDDAQRKRACELAYERLAVMEAQRAELDVAIADLKAELAHAEEKGLMPQHAA
jgi:DNA-binding transcriptional MerR regulator